MISVTSVTNNYILQPSLLGKHRKTLDWLSACLLWKRELFFFQKLLDRNVAKFSTEEDKMKVDHFQNIISFYDGELIDELSKKLRVHEKHLAEMLHTKNETLTVYFKEHDELMDELEALNAQLTHYKEELFEFIEKVM